MSETRERRERDRSEIRGLLGSFAFFRIFVPFRVFRDLSQILCSKEFVYEDFTHPATCKIQLERCQSG